MRKEQHNVIYCTIEIYNLFLDKLIFFKMTSITAGVCDRMETSGWLVGWPNFLASKTFWRFFWFFFNSFYQLFGHQRFLNIFCSFFKISSFWFPNTFHISFFCKGHNITTAVLTKYFQMQCNAILLHKTDINLGCVCVCTAVICFRFKFFEVESGNLGK